MKNRKLGKTLFAVLSASFLLCMNVMPVNAKAVYSDSTSVTNNGQVGAVDIELHQSFPEEQTMILPGQMVSIKSSVENKDQPAWIRVKLEYPVSGEGLEELEDSLVTFADGAWEKIGSYYYFKKPAATGDVIPFTEAIRFPEDWDNTMVQATLGMVFTAEAVQEKNFTPDFGSDDPWHGVVIEAYDGTDYVMKEENDERFSIIYKNGSEGLITVGDDFFSNWSDIMPGDELDGELMIENQMKIPVELYFDMENSGEEELLDMMNITITNGSKVVYDGPLSGAVKPEVLLKRYQTGEKTKFKYHLSVSPDITNTYALSEFTSVWTFSAKEIPPKAKPLPRRIIEIVKTGEYNLLIGGIGLGLIACAAGILYVRKRRVK